MCYIVDLTELKSQQEGLCSTQRIYSMVKSQQEGLCVTLVDLTGLKRQQEGLCATLLDLTGLKSQASRKGCVGFPSGIFSPNRDDF
jgi:hypothetical protein